MTIRNQWDSYTLRPGAKNIFAPPHQQKLQRLKWKIDAKAEYLLLLLLFSTVITVDTVIKLLHYVGVTINALKRGKRNAAVIFTTIAKNSVFWACLV